MKQSPGAAASGYVLKDYFCGEFLSKHQIGVATGQHSFAHEQNQLVDREGDEAYVSIAQRKHIIFELTGYHTVLWEAPAESISSSVPPVV